MPSQFEMGLAANSLRSHGIVTKGAGYRRSLELEVENLRHNYPVVMGILARTTSQQTPSKRKAAPKPQRKRATARERAKTQAWAREIAREQARKRQSAAEERHRGKPCYWGNS